MGHPRADLSRRPCAVCGIRKDVHWEVPGDHDWTDVPRVRPAADGCICGMADWQSPDEPYDGGDCRSIGCDPNCPACGEED